MFWYEVHISARQLHEVVERNRSWQSHIIVASAMGSIVRNCKLSALSLSLTVSLLLEGAASSDTFDLAAITDFSHLRHKPSRNGTHEFLVELMQ